MLKPTISTELPGRELLNNSGNMEFHFVERPKEIVKNGSWGIRQCPKVCFCLQFIVVRSILHTIWVSVRSCFDHSGRSVQAVNKHNYPWFSNVCMFILTQIYPMVVDRWIEETISENKDVEKRKLGLILALMQKDDILICPERSRLVRNLLIIRAIWNHCMKGEMQVWTIKDKVLHRDHNSQPESRSISESNRLLRR